jgi:hypothetical protein
VKTFDLLILFIAATLMSVAPRSFATSARGQRLAGTIQKVNAPAREAELLPFGKAKPLRFTWDKQTRFVADRHFVDATILRAGARVEVVSIHLFFASRYATNVMLLPTPSGSGANFRERSESNQNPSRRVLAIREDPSRSPLWVTPLRSKADQAAV